MVVTTNGWQALRGTYSFRSRCLFVLYGWVIFITLARCITYLYNAGMTLLQVRLDKQQHKQLKQLALDRDTSVSELIRNRIILMLKEAASKGVKN